VYGRGIHTRACMGTDKHDRFFRQQGACQWRLCLRLTAQLTHPISIFAM